MKTGILIALCLVGCQSKSHEAVVSERNKSPKVVGTETPSTEDIALINAALENLVKANDFEPQEGSTRIVLLENSIAKFNKFIEDNLVRMLDDRKAKQVDFDMRQDLAKRNQNLSSFKGFKFSPAIIVASETEVFGSSEMDSYNMIEKQRAKAYVHLYLPGYSKNRKSAILFFHFGPTPHGATCSMLMVKENNVWTVAWRKTAYYA